MVLTILLCPNSLVEGLAQYGPVVNKGQNMLVLLGLGEDYLPYLSLDFRRVTVFNPTLGGIEDDEAVCTVLDILKILGDGKIDYQAYNLKPGDRSPSERALARLLQEFLPDAPETQTALRQASRESVATK